MRQRIGVMLGIPTMTNRITIQVAALIDLLRVISKDEDMGFDFHYVLEHGKSPVEYARNVMAGSFLRSKCDLLWFVDEDMLPDKTVIRLLKSPFDIACARMYKFDHPNPDKGMSVGLTLCAFQRQRDNLYAAMMPDLGSIAVQECDAVGFGCTVIKRHVIEDRRLWSENQFTTMEGVAIDGNVMTDEGDYAPNIFRTLRSPSGGGLMGEDIDFCQRAKELGYKIGVDLNAVCGHFKPIDIDQAGFLAQKTVQRVLGGLRLENGKILKADLSDSLKQVDGPPIDKAIHAGDTLVKAL